MTQRTKINTVKTQFVIVSVKDFQNGEKRILHSYDKLEIAKQEFAHHELIGPGRYALAVHSVSDSLELY